MCETAGILKNENRIGGRTCRGCAPVNGRVVQLHVEVSDQRTTVDSQIRRRWNESLFDVVKLLNQRLLRCASRARA